MPPKTSSAASYGHSAERSLEADDPAAGGRDAHRACVIGADRERPHAGGDRGRGTPARSARRAIELPRVACDTPERAVVESLVTELAHRGHADRDRARGLQALHRDCVAVRDVLLEHVGAVGEAHAFGRDHVLDRERHAMQGTELAARRDLALGAFCRRERGLRINHGVGVECGLQPFDAGEERLHELDRRQLLAPDARSELRRRREAEVFLVRCCCARHVVLSTVIPGRAEGAGPESILTSPWIPGSHTSLRSACAPE